MIIGKKTYRKSNTNIQLHSGGFATIWNSNGFIPEPKWNRTESRLVRNLLRRASTRMHTIPEFGLQHIDLS